MILDTYVLHAYVSEVDFMAVVIINGFRFSSNSPLVIRILEDNNIKINTECRAGYCGQCKCEVKNPEAVKHSDDVIAALGHDQILPCSAYVVDDQELEFVNFNAIKM
jgi:ferredoxin